MATLKSYYGIILILTIFLLSHSGGIMLRQLTSCVCPGHELVFECTVEGGFTTKWQGTIFDWCTDGDIILRHSQFYHRATTRRHCSDAGLVLSQPISAINNIYRSQLILTFNQQLNNKTVQCATDQNIIDESQILVRKEQLVPPNVYLTSVSHGQLKFSWTFTSQDCPTLYHKINSSRCGECPYNTTSNSIVCRNYKPNVSTSPQLCLLSVESVVCDSLRGVVSEPILLLVQGLQNRIGTAISEYMKNSLYIKRIFLEIDYLESLSSKETPFTIIFTNESGECSSVTIPSSLCTNGSCIYTFNVPLSPCSNSTQINVRVAATLSNVSDERDVTTVTVITLATVFATAAIIILLIVIVTAQLILLLKCYRYYHNSHFKQNNSGLSTAEELTLVMSPRINVGDSQAEIVFPLGSCSSLPTDGESRELEAEDSQNFESDNPDSESVLYANRFHDVDKMLNLDTLLTQIRDQVTPKWYKFGVAVGINLETLNELSNLPPEECIVEMLDLWLRTNETAITWRDVANALKDTGLYLLAERILKVYKTGELPTAVDEGFNILDMPFTLESKDQLSHLESPQNFSSGEQVGEFCPPLPPKNKQMFQ